MKDHIIRAVSVLHYSFQAISSNCIVFLLFPYTCFWKEEAKQEASQTSLAECFVIQVVTGKEKNATWR